MEINKEFLEKLIQYGETKGVANVIGEIECFFQEEKIGNIPHTCCPSATTLVYDFDETKRLVSNSSTPKLGLKSCDALKVLVDEEKIDFIEFKRFQEFIQSDLEQGENDTDLIKSKIEKFDLQGKINDSLVVLQTLINYQNFGLTREEKKVFSTIEKRFIVLIDIEPQNTIESLTTTLTMLENANSDIIVQSVLQDNLDSIPGSSLQNLGNPILKHCGNIDAFYS